MKITVTGSEAEGKVKYAIDGNGEYNKTQLGCVAVELGLKHLIENKGMSLQQAVEFINDIKPEGKWKIVTDEAGVFAEGRHKVVEFTTSKGNHTVYVNNQWTPLRSDNFVIGFNERFADGAAVAAPAANADAEKAKAEAAAAKAAAEKAKADAAAEKAKAEIEKAAIEKAKADAAKAKAEAEAAAAAKASAEVAKAKAEVERLKAEAEMAKAEAAALAKAKAEIDAAKAEAEKAKAAVAQAQAAAANIQTDDVRAVSTARTKDGHPYVDLGLPSRLKWATMNIGAEYEDDWGNYFEFGDTKVETTFGVWSRCVKDHNLQLNEDAAAQIWKGGWRMPSSQEFRELLDGCTWEWTDDYKSTGCPGLIGTSKKNQNQIFFPASGFKYTDVAANYKGQCGYYWSSSYGYESSNYYGKALRLSKNERELKNLNRNVGYSIRPVIE